MKTDCADRFRGLVCSNKDDWSKHIRMQETVYLLLRCDEILFLETDEKDAQLSSFSWVHSLRATLPLFELSESNYPQGSLSANAQHYLSLQKFVGRGFAETPWNTKRSFLLNLLRMRRDPQTGLFGSRYTVGPSGTREGGNNRHVETSPRHSAAAMVLLLREIRAGGCQCDEMIEASAQAVVNEASKAVQGSGCQGFLLITLAVMVGLFRELLETADWCDFPRSDRESYADLKERCIKRLKGHDCFKSALGTREWVLPNEGMGRFVPYLVAFIGTHAPEVLASPDVVTWLCALAENCEGIGGIPAVTSPNGTLLGASGEIGAAEGEQALRSKPDFGSTLSVGYLLYNALDYDHSKDLTQRAKRLCKACFENARRLYDKPEAYIIPHSEGYSRALLLPKAGKDRMSVLDEVADKVRDTIAEVMGGGGSLHRMLAKIDFPEGLEHVRKIVLGWNVPVNSAKWRLRVPWDDLVVLGGRILLEKASPIP